MRKRLKRILANRILSGVKTSLSFGKGREGRRLSCKTSGVFGIKDHNGGYGYAGAGCIGTGRSINRQQNIAGELSKEAKKELFIKNQDKG